MKKTYFGFVVEETEGGVKFQLFSGENVKEVNNNIFVASDTNKYRSVNALSAMEFNTSNIIKAFAWLLQQNVSLK